MTESEYKDERERLSASLFRIRRPKFFPRCVRARLKAIARLDAAFYGGDCNEGYKELHESFYDKFIQGT